MSNPLINLEKLSEPLTKLVQVTSKGVGKLYAPFGTVRQARADAESKIIHAHADLEVLNIQERAKERIIHKESLRQENIEKIVCQAALELPDAVSSEPLDDDWIIQFFNQAQDVCDDELQKLWSRILAGEVSVPNSYSKRTLQFLKTLDKWEAEKFSELCSFALTTDEEWHIIFNDKLTGDLIEKVLGKGGWMNHFESIGLLMANSACTPSSISGTEINYFDKKYIIDGPDKPKQGTISALEMPLFWSYFSMIGQQLAKISGATPDKTFIEKLEQSLKSQNIKLSFREISENDKSKKC